MRRVEPGFSSHSRVLGNFSRPIFDFHSLPQSPRSPAAVLSMEAMRFRLDEPSATSE